MCGIFGITSLEENKENLINGIKKLEYRGYDSAGIAFFNKQNIKTIKAVGEINKLEKAVHKKECKFTCGIAHTRWATHGKPTLNNAHPHISKNKQFALVHNGIIENFKELQEVYLKEVPLQSETDSEIVVQLMEKLFCGDVLKTLKEVCDKIKGSYAFCLIYKKEPGKIYATRKDSPLVLAHLPNCSVVASDVSAILSYSKEQFILKNKEYAVITQKEIQFYNENLETAHYLSTDILETTDETQKQHFSHFMIKEIYEIPAAIKATLKEYSILKDIYNVIPKQVFQKTKHIKIIACGTAYHAGLLAKQVLETIQKKIMVEVLIASEFRYSSATIPKHTLCIFISQSGETADTLSSVKKCKELGVKTVSITNVKNSSITYLTDYNLYTMAGREIAVASTKAYNSQLALLYLLSSFFTTNVKKEFNKMQQEIKTLFKKETLIKELENKVKELSQKYKDVNHIYLIGRGIDYETAKEASLKLKEITYTHCEAYPAGELKHGTLSLIEKGVLVICFLTQKAIFDKTLNALFEVKSRGADVLLITSQEGVEETVFDEIIILPFKNDLFLPFISVIPAQLLAFHNSLAKGINPDKPRNLAKAVTVE